MDIISMAQQARPNPSGQMELLRAQFTALSSVVKMMPSSSRSLPKSSGLVSVTCLPRDTLIVTSKPFSHKPCVADKPSVKSPSRPRRSFWERESGLARKSHSKNVLCLESSHFLRVGNLNRAKYGFRRSELGIHNAGVATHNQRTDFDLDR